MRLDADPPADPWLMGQVRLAERRGLLGGGRPLSRVQHACVELCLLLDAREKTKDLVNQYRFALVTADPRLSEKLFPEWFKVESRDITDEDMVDSKGEWRFEEKVTPEEAQRRWEEALSSVREGSLSLSQVEADSDDGWV